MIVLFDWQNEGEPGKVSFKIEVSFKLLGLMKVKVRAEVYCIQHWPQE